MVNKKKKKIVLLSWEILELGGINRLVSGYQTGFRKLGYEVITYHISRGGRLSIEEDDFTLMTKWFRPSSINLGWENKDQLKEYASHCKDAEFVLSIHGCPHPTKSGAKGDYGWHKIYQIPRIIGTPIGILFTDNLWDKLYRWIEDVIDGDIKVFYDNYNAKFDSMQKLKWESIYVDYPIDFDEQLTFGVESQSRPIDVAWLPQIKRWKGIYQFIDQLRYYPNAFYTVIFNSGIEYYNMRNGDVWEKAIRYEHRPKTGPDRNTRNYFNKLTHNPKSTTDYFGLVFPDQVNQIHAKSKVCLDLSGGYSKKFQSQVTCAMLEPMVNKSLVAVPPHVAEDSKSRIRGLDIVYPLELNALIDSLEEIIKDEKKRTEIANRAYEWASLNCRDTIVAKRLIRYMEE